MISIRRYARNGASVLLLLLGGCTTSGEQPDDDWPEPGLIDTSKPTRHNPLQHDPSRHDPTIRNTTHRNPTHRSPTGHHRSSETTRQAVLMGQYAFATIGETVALLEADPETDWGSVDVEGLRQHLIDMHRVTLEALVESRHIDGGARFVVRGSDARTQASIRRMVSAHVQTMAGAGMEGRRAGAGSAPWQYVSAPIDGGMTLTVTAGDARGAERIRGLGFLGVMVLGNHHPTHHRMLATGQNPHQNDH